MHCDIGDNPESKELLEDCNSTAFMQKWEVKNGSAEAAVFP